MNKLHVEKVERKPSSKSTRLVEVGDGSALCQLLLLRHLSLLRDPLYYKKVTDDWAIESRDDQSFL